MLAETGLGVAQHNAAHLCELLDHSSACQWRYHNYSTYNHIPQEAGELVALGDYYSELADMVKAIDMYSTAAVYGSAQGLFNLVTVIEEGYEVPDIILDQMGLFNHTCMNLLSPHDPLPPVGAGEEGDVTPCSLVLWRMELMRAWRDFTHSSVQLTLACGVFATLAVSVFAVLLRTVTELAGQDINDSPLETRRENQQQIYQPTVAHNHLSVQKTSDLILTVTGVCACVIFIMFISHLL
ncbi:uncharacterized protein [Sinocyclocheilus grahami]|uniref:uncharacterized protein n=1 Tax=Sinocyclocheilus grahami TaxID=75366 RepID=UPI0007AD4A66|nr:PREDICTED: uncharacterized protein LOC107549162 [Sinocyclocheilus grahami]